MKSSVNCAFRVVGNVEVGFRIYIGFHMCWTQFSLRLKSARKIETYLAAWDAVMTPGILHAIDASPPPPPPTAGRMTTVIL
jgi:hypothetical protein